jgi:hypothetical protein
MRKRRAVLAFGAILAVAAPLHAEDRSCVGVFFADAPILRIARVKAGAARVNFVRGGRPNDPCPGDDASCRETAFLVPGDLFILGARLGGFACADYARGKAARAGWLPFESIETVAPLSDPSAFAGVWKRPVAEIAIAWKDGKLTADALATFGANDPDRRGHGAVNTGEFEGVLSLNGGQAEFNDETVDPKDPHSFGCRVRLARAGDLLFVRDNQQCGGFNVSFDGTYSRKR